MAKPQTTQSVWMYYETDGDSGFYAICLFSTEAKAREHQRKVNSAYGRVGHMEVK